MVGASISARLFYRIWSDDFGLFAIKEEGQNRSIGVSITFEDRPRCAALDAEPTLSLNREGAQKLMDDLYDAGLRPSQERRSEAQGRHLEDMRTIAFGKLKIEKPS